ncbi:hypothetical protein BB560_006656 [Smittium megazygosporum]|uniref:Uncharacterized protein n=1 Tax=Smittium megazygosporum TaxID=133381 RepID=A0A2T9Y2L7_9FUNG|nr:hypothetical protein BB560_006656 [Smittium megazygosporum]
MVNSVSDSDSDIPTLSAYAAEALKDQFWYSDATSEYLSNIAHSIAAKNDSEGLIVFMSSPTAFVKFVDMYPNYQNVYLLEFDQRFNLYKEKYYKYDYNKQSELPGFLTQNKAATIILDPPFLNEDCLTKFMASVSLLSDDNTKVLLCSGAVMKPLAQTFNLKQTNFFPEHKKSR